MFVRPTATLLFTNQAVKGRAAAAALQLTTTRAFSAVAEGDLYPMPAAKPCPDFSSGPCKKRPGWTTDIFKSAPVGRSHRSKIGKAKLSGAIDIIVRRGETHFLPLLLWPAQWEGEGLRGAGIGLPA